MKPLLNTVIAIGLGLCTQPVFSQVKLPPDRLGSSVQVTFPIGDIKIKYVESNEGMVLIANCKVVSVRSQRMYLGDGKSAVLFAATNNGVQTPNGLLNAAAIDVKNGITITVHREKLEPWGAKRGETYLLVPNLKFKVSEE